MKEVKVNEYITKKLERHMARIFVKRQLAVNWDS